MMKKQQITIGDYKVQQASNCHVFIVHIPDSRMVFHSQTNHWLTEEELRAAFGFLQAGSRMGDGRMFGVTFFKSTVLILAARAWMASGREGKIPDDWFDWGLTVAAAAILLNEYAR